LNIDGIINVNKEKGYTSFDVVACLRGIIGMRKIGHTGTLDPDATGVLPVCLGKATKVVDFLTDKQKTYKAIFKTGFVTDTQDVSGTVIEKFNGSVTLDEVIATLTGFVGEYSQIPPMYSALKHNGKKLYKLAREGIVVEREARARVIHSISQIEQLSNDTFSFEVTCSKGTYIRTLIYDVGNSLNVGATMTELERTLVEPFRLENAYTLKEIEEIVKNNKINDIIMKIDELFETYKALVVSAEYEKALYNGNKLPIQLLIDKGYKVIENERYRVYDSNKRFIGLYKIVDRVDEEKIIKILKVDKMFY